MSTIFMSSKGGNCTTVTAAAFALHQAASGIRTIIIDLCGDQPAVLGLAEPQGPGINDWLAEDSNATISDLLSLGTVINDNVLLLHRGSRFVTGEPRWSDFAELMSSDNGYVVIDAGSGYLPDDLRLAVTHITLVIRPCYIALRRAAHQTRPTDVFAINEPERALTVKDIGHVLGVPIHAEVPHSAVISRAVDAGVFPGRVQQLFAGCFTTR
jgi:hypothetical protein